MSSYGIYKEAMQVIRQCDQDELLVFYQWYLRRDPMAQMKVLVRFSDKIDRIESQRYEWLIYKLIKSLRQNRKTLGIIRQKQLANLFSELQEQASDAVVLHHYLKAFYICRHSMSSIRLIAQKEGTLHDSLKQRHAGFLKILFQLYAESPPQSLISEMYDFINQEAGHHLDISPDNYYSLPRLDIRLGFSMNDKEHLEFSDNWLDRYQSLEQAASYVYVILTEDWDAETWKFIGQQPIPTHLLKQSILWMMRDNLIESYQIMAEHIPLKNILEEDKYSEFRTQIAEWLNQHTSVKHPTF